MRLNFTEEEIDKIFEALRSDEEVRNLFLQRYAETKAKLQNNSKKKEAAAKATEARTAVAKKKIEDAINLLRIENKKINYNTIAKRAKVSYLTVKKYVTL